MAVEKSVTKKVIINSMDKEGQIFVGFNGVGYSILCNQEVELPSEVIAILKDSVEVRHVADRDESGKAKGSKAIEEKRYIVEVV